MKTTSILLPTLLLAALSARGATTLESSEFFVDLRESPRVSAGTETLTYSTRWAGADALAGCTRKARLAVAGYAGEEALEDVPVLVRLSTAIQGFDYDDFAAPATGADLVFCDEAETTVYPHEIDEWNTNGESLVWVRLPALAAGTAFKMGYGGTPATAADVAAAAHAVWSDYAGVWHMNEDSGTAFDSTANGLDAVPSKGTNTLADVSQMVAFENGACGRARVNATTNLGWGPKMVVPSYDRLHLGSTFVFSGWFFVNEILEASYPKLVFRNWDYGGWGLELCRYSNGRNVSMVGGAGSSQNGTWLNAVSFQTPILDGWKYITAVYNGASGFLYENGILLTNGVITVAGDNGNELIFGGASGERWHSLNGQYDELRLRGGTLSADRIRADYDMIANSSFVTCGSVETIAGSGLEIRLGGEVFVEGLTGEGTVPWTPTGPGTYEFEHVSLVDGTPVAVESASFEVPGPADDDLSIVAEGDLVEGVSVRLGGVPDGWTLHYTTNGSTPTADSPAYTGPFALAESATVKVVAVSDAHGWTSGVAEQRFNLAPPLAVTGARARQRYPWNGLVDVDFTLEGDASRRYRVTLEATDLAGGTNLALRTVWEDGGSVTNAALDIAPGLHRFVWNADADLPAGFVADQVAIDVRAEAIHDTALYMVVDLSGGPDAERYPVSYLPDVPEGGWTDEYKTDKLVLRRVEPGNTETCDQPMFAAVFEMTQGQFEKVADSNPSQETGALRPVDSVSYDDLRGTGSGSLWPVSGAVDDASFIGVFRGKTGLPFDLPNARQWEYACRAGTTSDYNNGGSTESDLQQAGRYSGNISDGIGGCSGSHTTVGSYRPNAWSLYDMHGNVQEWCLDWFGTDSEIEQLPNGPTSGPGRVVRGGGFGATASECKSSGRGWNGSSFRGTTTGFRLFLHNAPAVVEAPIVAPAGLTATTNRTGDVTLSWEPVAGAYAYQIRRSKTGAFEDGTWLNTVTNTAYADWTAESRTDYSYWVRAQFESGKVGRWSEGAEGKRHEITAQNALYMVIDLSGGSAASSYPVSYLDAVPAGGWTDEYKTTKMVFRKVEAGTFTMGSPSSESGRGSNETQHQVTITKPFFISVFEMTEKQYAQIAGGSDTSKKPVRLQYSAVRGADVKYSVQSKGMQDIWYANWTRRTFTFSVGDYCWPNKMAVNSSSVVGKLRTRTGLTGVDLPTEAQWEFACRGGSAMSSNYGGSVGSSSLTDVGTCPANSIGLYDMLGNAFEWCLDAVNSKNSIPDYGSTAQTDPKGANLSLLCYSIEFHPYAESTTRSPYSGTGTSYTSDDMYQLYSTYCYSYRIARGGGVATSSLSGKERPASRTIFPSAATSCISGTNASEKKHYGAAGNANFHHGVRLVVPVQ